MPLEELLDQRIAYSDIIMFVKYRHVQKVFGHNDGVVYADDRRVIKSTGENIINKLFKLKRVITYCLILCEVSFEPNNLLNSLWYRTIQALNVSRRDSGPDPPNFLDQIGLRFYSLRARLEFSFDVQPHIFYYI